MRILGQNYRTGELRLVEAPAPQCRPGGVLVRNEYSLISTGTELMKVHESKLSLLGMARARPDQVRKVLESVQQQGVAATYRKVTNRLDSFTPLGYSTCGVIVEVGDGVEELEEGQRVACAGNQFAHHAETNWVPRQLCVPVPDSVESRHAAFTTVGAIAMQAFRQSSVRLGETACVIGLGLLGQLLAQILNAAGVKVVGLDLVGDRCRLAESLGVLACGVPGEPSFDHVGEALDRATAKHGADAVFLTVGGSSNEPVELAAELARDRAQVIDVGKCSLDLPWKEYYEKELEVRFSRSYGPGRYDPNYEERGIDYPIGYVRWTERRNMASFVDLLEQRDLNLDPLISHVFPFDEAVDVFERMAEGDLAGIGILYRYPDGGDKTPAVEPGSDRVMSRDAPAAPPAKSRDRLRIGAIGCGNYASTMLLPHLVDRKDIELVEVVTRTSLSAANAAKKHGFRRMSTEVEHLLEADDVDAVMVLTRHASHARFVIDALAAGKTVFVEKPLAITKDEIQKIVDTVRRTGNDRLMVGFNRRFSPILVELREKWGGGEGLQVAHYRVNAGPLSADSWYADTGRHGSRFVGEGCHFVDTLSWWLDSDPVRVHALHTPDDPDNLVATFRFADGSTGIVSYLTDGDTRYPKEMFEAFGRGSVARLDNFRKSEMWRGGKPDRDRALLRADKGQADEMDAFVRAARTGSPMPIPFASLVATTRATLAAHRSAVRGEPVEIA